METTMGKADRSKKGGLGQDRPVNVFPKKEKRVIPKDGFFYDIVSIGREIEDEEADQETNEQGDCPQKEE